MAMEICNMPLHISNYSMKYNIVMLPTMYVMLTIKGFSKGLFVNYKKCYMYGLYDKFKINSVIYF